MVSRDDFLSRAKAGVQEKYSKKDLQLMQAVRSLDDIDDAKSLLYTRLQEWFKLNFPELELSNEESYCAIVAAFGSKEAVDEARLAEIVGESKAAEIAATAKRSFGGSFDEADIGAIKEFASKIGGLIGARKALEGYITEQANIHLRNLAYMVEPVLAARIVTVAGGLDKLAVMPASTIQVIGAESALFKHIKTGSNPPKHGVIFQCSYIRGAPLERRGRIARALASKLAIAAKADYFSGNFIAEKLKSEFEARVKEVDELKLAPRFPPTPEEERRRDFGGGRKFGRSGGNFGQRGDSRSSSRQYGDKPRYGGKPGYQGSKPGYGSSGGERSGYGGKKPFGGKPGFSGGSGERKGYDRPRPSRYGKNKGRRPFR